MAAEQTHNSTNSTTTTTTTITTTTTVTNTSKGNSNKWIKNMFKQSHTTVLSKQTLRRLNSRRSFMLQLLLLLLHCTWTQRTEARAALDSQTTLPILPLAAPLLGGKAAADALNATINELEANTLPRMHTPVNDNGASSGAGGGGAAAAGGGAVAGAGAGAGAGATSDAHDHSRALKRVYLSNNSITCNDGTHAGFYWRKNVNSKKWIVFLEGGWHCYDTRTCRARWMRLRHLMTSTQWPATRTVGGILSPQAEENPYWHNANHVLVPYCSSDSWSGTLGEPTSRDDWRFMGALILRQVIADLIPLGLGRSTGAELLLVGSSAGGLGVMLNLDRIRDFLVHERKLPVTVRGVSDSGWFLDREPYTPAAVAASESVRRGWKLWQGLLPEACTKEHEAEPWRCYFGYRLYPTLTTPLFVFQWLFDEAQMRADNVGAPVTPEQWNYIHEMGGALRSSLDNVTAVFAPSCIGHAVLSKRDWVNIKIDDISLPAALRCWEHATRRKRHDKLKRSTEPTTLQRHQKHREREEKQNNLERTKHKRKLNKAQREARKRRRQQQQEARRKQRRRNQQRKHKPNEAGGSGPGADDDDNNNNSNNSSSGGNSSNSSSSSNDAKQKPIDKLRANGTNKHHHQQQQQQQQASSHNHRRNHDNEETLLRRQEKRRRRRKQKLQQQQQQEQQQQQQHEQQQQQQQQQQRRQQQQQQLQPKSQRGLDMQDEQPTSALDPHKTRASNTAKRRHRVPRVPEKCALRLLERCSWPQCNHSCPTLTNPLTGEEMRFLELLTSFGLDIEAVAAALGVDMHTLNNMDRTELVNLLTQQVS